MPVNAPLLIYNGGAAYDLEREEILFMQEIQMDMWKTIPELLELFPDLAEPSNPPAEDAGATPL